MNHPSNRREMEQLIMLSEMPEQYRQIMVENGRMSKKIRILEAELQEKSQIIHQLKQQLDAGVVEHTQEKLAYSRTVQEEIENRVKQIKQQQMEKAIDKQHEIQELHAHIKQMEEKIALQVNKNDILFQKIDSLKFYIADVIEEKDFLIAELGAIISDQQKKMSICKCGTSTSIKGFNSTPMEKQIKKKTAIIRRNQ